MNLLSRRCYLICRLYAVVWLTAGGLSAAEAFDLILRHGRVIDGTGNPAYFADVGIKAGRIAAVGKITTPAKSELDISGLVLAPGFIDVHTHADSLAKTPAAGNFIRMGVTTIIAGNCGDSAPNLAKWFRELETTRIAVNVATLAGHDAIRETVMEAAQDRLPTPEELQRMKGLVAQAMQDGAVGLSTGLIYLPGSLAKTEELLELAKVAAAYDGIYTSHMRNEGQNIFGALEEVFRIARGANIRAQVSHLKLSGLSSKQCWGQAEQVLAAIEKARASGLDITQDQYVYTASSTGLAQLIPAKYRKDDKFAEFYAHPARHFEMVAEMKNELRRSGWEDYATTVIAHCKKDLALNGLNIVEAARKKRGASSVEDQIELILEVQAKGGATGIFHTINEGDLQKFAQHPNTMFASDSGLKQPGETGTHPRGYGNNARVLARYVRELKLLRLEDAIRRMTSLPATTFKLKDRGLIQEGAWADLVVFDPAKVQANATYDKPHQYATGFAYVMVNGLIAVKNDVQTSARPGHVLRHGRSRIAKEQ